MDWCSFSPAQPKQCRPRSGCSKRPTWQPAAMAGGRESVSAHRAVKPTATATTFGIAVVEAARLCAAALPDHILVSDLVRALTRGLEHKFVTSGEFTLKGLPEP